MVHKILLLHPVCEMNDKYVPQVGDLEHQFKKAEISEETVFKPKQIVEGDEMFKGAATTIMLEHLKLCNISVWTEYLRKRELLEKPQVFAGPVPKKTVYKNVKDDRPSSL